MRTGLRRVEVGQCVTRLNTTVYAGGKVYRKPGDRCSRNATIGPLCRTHFKKARDNLEREG
jgi:hypothetical protein